MPTKVTLRLQTLTCGSETEGGAEPYIWPILIGEEGGVPILHIPPPEFAGKVLKNQMRAGESVGIPGGMNVLEHLFQDPAAGLLVCIVALFEKDSSPLKGTKAVLDHVTERAVNFVRNRLAECRQGNGNRSDLRSAFVNQLDLAGAEVSALSITERIVTRLSSGSFDDSIGLAFQTFSGAAIAARDLTFDVGSNSEAFTLTGSLKRTLVLPPRCQAERDALAQAEARVNGLHLQRQSLQQQLHTATPQQKPALIDLIQKIAEVDLPAAEAAMAAAKAALDACLASFPHGPLDSPVVVG